jgi:hypothetical protein
MLWKVFHVTFFCVPIVADAAAGPSVLISETSIQFQWEPSAVIGEGTFGKVFLGRSVVV